MRKSPIDVDLDPDLGPALRNIASCAVTRCPHDPRPVGTKAKTRPLCRAHHAAAMRDWRAKRRAAKLSIAGASPRAPSSSRTAIRQRVALHRAIASGKVDRRPCGDCGTAEGVLAIVLDPARPEARTWRCRAHRYAEVVERERAKAQAADEAARYAQYATLPARRRTALELLAQAPPDIAAAIHAEAARFMGITLAPHMPLYTARLTQIAESRLRENSAVDS